MSVAGKKACIVGAGFGGLALGIRLQAAGVATTIVEARDIPGGCAGYWQREGFTFDAGPTVITDTAALDSLWRLSGHDMGEDVELLRVHPFCRYNWPDGVTFDLSGDDTALLREIARVAPEDISGFEDFMRYCAHVYHDCFVRLASHPFPSRRAMARAAPALIRHRTWRSLYDVVSRYIESPKLRQALSTQTLRLGGNPMKQTALYALIHKMERESGIWCVRGGTNQLIAGLVRHFERLGGTIRLGDPVTRLHTLGNRVTEVETASRWKERFDVVASNADLMHTYRDLLGHTQGGNRNARKLSRKRYAPGAFLVHFGLEGSWPGIPHHTMLLGPRYRGLMEDIFDHGVLPQDFAIFLDHPSVTDSSLAPEGKSVFTALVPVAHMGKLTVDWEQLGPMLEKRVLDEVGRRLIPDIHARIVTSFHYTPRDFSLDLNAYMGSAYGLEPRITQTAWLRPHNRDETMENFYLTGANTHPGPGVPAVIAGAKITAALMLEDMAR
ncbi:MAG: phytoene desaturase family protein [Novosphingobium sp.]